MYKSIVIFLGIIFICCGAFGATVIVIDPGHGGKDPGATGVNGVHEKDVVLAIAKDMQKTINKNKAFKAVLTRNGDYFLTLRQRLNIAHEDKADAFIAIHADANKFKGSHGASVYALSQRGETSEGARWLAERENESELGQAMADKSNSVRSVLLDLSQTASINESLAMGNSILRHLSACSRIHSRHVDQAAFVVLKSPDIPSLLIETGFISDSVEEAKLSDAAYQKRLAKALADGVVDYFKHHPVKRS